MEAVREKWTDERLDDMNERISDGFDRLDKDLREVRSELSGARSELANGRTHLTAEIGSVRSDLLEEMNKRFEATHRLIIQVGGGLFGTMVVGFLGLVLTQH